MKEKIFTALKAACGKNTCVSDKTLEKLAETMATTVTEESQIEAAVELQKPILQAIDANINFTAAEAVKKVKLEKPAPGPDPKPDPPKPDPDEPAWFKTYRETSEKRINDLTEKLTLQEKKEAAAHLTTKLITALKEKNVPESYFKGRNLAIESEDKIAEIAAAIETDYSGFKQELTEQGVIISIPPSSPGTLKAGEQLGKSLAEKRNASATAGVEGKPLK
jgi:hypothetical protein